MTKKELMELIKDITDEGNVDNVLPSDIVKERLNADKDLKAWLDSVKDVHAEKYNSTWKQNNLQKLIDAEVLKITGKNESAEQKAIRELQEKLANMEKEKTRAEMVSKYKDTLSEKKIPSKLIDFVLGNDDEVTTANIDLFENSMKEYIEAQVSDRLKSGYTPPKNDNTDNLSGVEKAFYSKNPNLK